MKLWFPGQVELAELDGPFVKISLKGRFWHKRSTVVARLGNYMKQRIPVSQKLVFTVLCVFIRMHCSFTNNFWFFWCQEILEVEIEDEKQLDDSPENF